MSKLLKKAGKSIKLTDQNEDKPCYTYVACHYMYSTTRCKLLKKAGKSIKLTDQNEDKPCYTYVACHYMYSTTRCKLQHVLHN